MFPRKNYSTFFGFYPIGDSMMENRVYIKCPVSLYLRVTIIDSVKLDMLDIDVILGMYWLNACYASIDCRIWVVNSNMRRNLF